MYSCKQKAACSRARGGGIAQISLNRRKERAINMEKLGKGILLKGAKTSVVMKEKAAVGSTRRCGPSWGLDECVSGYAQSR
jgi:hypothetical protein